MLASTDSFIRVLPIVLKRRRKWLYSDLNAMIGKSTFFVKRSAIKNGDFLCLFVFACYGQPQFLV